MHFSNIRRIVLLIVIMFSILPLGLDHGTDIISTSETGYEMINGRRQLVEIGGIEAVSYLSLFGIEIARKTGFEARVYKYENVTKNKYMYAGIILLVGLVCLLLFTS